MYLIVSCVCGLRVLWGGGGAALRVCAIITNLDSPEHRGEGFSSGWAGSGCRARLQSAWWLALFQVVRSVLPAGTAGGSVGSRTVEAALACLLCPAPPCRRALRAI